MLVCPQECLCLGLAEECSSLGCPEWAMFELGFEGCLGVHPAGSDGKGPSGSMAKVCVQEKAAGGPHTPHLLPLECCNYGLVTTGTGCCLQTGPI